jgi:outer membrane protein assembly factor BamB
LQRIAVVVVAVLVACSSCAGGSTPAAQRSTAPALSSAPAVSVSSTAVAPTSDTPTTTQPPELLLPGQVAGPSSGPPGFEGVPSMDGPDSCTGGYAPTLLAASVKTGLLQWAHCPPEPGIFATVAATATRVLAISGSDNPVQPRQILMAFDAADGTVVWDFGITGYVLDQPGVFTGGGVVVLAEGEGTIVALDVETGVQRWSLPADGLFPFAHSESAVFLTETPLPGRNASLPRLRALERTTGNELWTANEIINAGPGFPIAVAASTVASEEATQSGGLFGIDASTGQRLWSGTRSADSVFGAGDVILGEVPFQPGAPIGGVFALDARTGEERWTAAGRLFDNESWAVGDGVLVLADDNGAFAVDLADGKERWRDSIGGRVFGVGVGAGAVFTNWGALAIAAQSAADGSPLWFLSLTRVGQSFPTNLINNDSSVFVAFSDFAPRD